MSVYCHGCGEMVPDEVAYQDGGPFPFHWNERGGGHTTRAEVRMSGKFTVVTRHLSSGYVSVSGTFDSYDDAKARREELVGIAEDDKQVFHSVVVCWSL